MTRGELDDERTFLLRSLEDLDREHDAGDLSDEDHAVLRDGYVARTAEVLQSLDGVATTTAAGASGPGRRHRVGRRTVTGAAPARARRRRRLVVAGMVVVVGAAIVSVVAHVGPRLPGESVTGSVTLTPAEQTAQTLAQAETYENQGDAVDAVKQYEVVLHRDPTDEPALAELGWLEYEAGAEAGKGTLLSLGETEEQKAERVDPGGFAPHLYLGTMLLAQRDPEGAVAQYRLFLADHPSRAKVVAAASFIEKAFSQAHQTPPALPLGGANAG